MENKSTLFQHQDENHRELPPYICKECLWESETWYEYVQHMKMHLRFTAKCTECVYSAYMMNKLANAIFLCQLCDMSFDSKDELKLHIQIHF